LPHIECGGGSAPSLAAKSIDFICGRTYETAHLVGDSEPS
jgi:hypothetical protein